MGLTRTGTGIYPTPTQTVLDMLMREFVLSYRSGPTVTPQHRASADEAPAAVEQERLQDTRTGGEPAHDVQVVGAAKAPNPNSINASPSESEPAQEVQVVGTEEPQ